MLKRTPEGQPLNVKDGQLVVVQKTGGRSNFARIGTAPLLDQMALVAFHPIIDDKTRHITTQGVVQEDGSVTIPSVKEATAETYLFKARHANLLDRWIYAVGSKLLGW